MDDTSTLSTLPPEILDRIYRFLDAPSRRALLRTSKRIGKAMASAYRPLSGPYFKEEYLRALPLYLNAARTAKLSLYTEELCRAGLYNVRITDAYCFSETCAAVGKFAFSVFCVNIPMHNVRWFKNVRVVGLTRCALLQDVRDIAGAYSVWLERCPLLSNINALGNVKVLQLISLPRVVYYGKLTGVKAITIEDALIGNVSPFRNAERVTVLDCPLLEDISPLNPERFAVQGCPRIKLAPLLKMSNLKRPVLLQYVDANFLDALRQNKVYEKFVYDPRSK